MTRESESSISPLHSIRRRSPGEKPGLDTLPYDLLLNVASYLELTDVHSLHLTCKSLHEFSKARPVYRRFATDLLRRCRALPLKGFQQLTDLTTDQLVRSVNRATRYDEAWRVREPRPISSPSASNYMDGEPPTSTSWFKIVSAPPNEEVDWLSPITSSYTLCATKKGKVVCWDVQTDRCLAEWNPGEKWELWKCRVEFDQRTVYFTMAKVLAGSYSDNRVMKFVLMKLTFSDGPTGATCHDPPPVFSHVTDFRTAGVVMNVFLLDPTSRLLSAFIWVATSNTIGLYVLLDWDKPKEYVFVDTGIECVTSSNWSCILFEDHIVIHCEESDAAFQHFYPLSLLQKYVKTLPRKNSVPVLSFYVKPGRTLKKRFRFPVLARRPLPPSMEPTLILGGGTTANGNGGGIHVNGGGTASTVPIGGTVPVVNLTQILNGSTTTTTLAPVHPTTGPQHQQNTNNNPNPYPVPPWYPESAHFVRQWWPTLAGVPKVSCTVVLLAALEEDIAEFSQFYYGEVLEGMGPDDFIGGGVGGNGGGIGGGAGQGGRGRTKFVLVQHYFRVPISHRGWVHERDVCPRKHKARRRRRPHANGAHGAGAATNGHPNGNGATNASQSESETDSDTEDEDDEEDNEEDLFTTCGCDIGSLTEKQRALVRQDEVLMNMWYVSRPFEVVRVSDGEPGASYSSTGSGSGEGGGGGGNSSAPGYLYGGEEQDEYELSDEEDHESENENENGDERREQDAEVRSEDADADADPERSDQEDEEEELFGDQDDPEGTGERPRPLVAVDFGHAVWIEHYDPPKPPFVPPSPISVPPWQQRKRAARRARKRMRSRRTYGMDAMDEDEDEEGGDTEVEENVEEEEEETSRNRKKRDPNANLRLRFVTFPKFRDECEYAMPEVDEEPSHDEEVSAKGKKRQEPRAKRKSKIEAEGVVRTLKVPDELNLGSVETINIDQSQGAVILSDRERKIWILCYE